MRAFENCLVCGASTENTHSARRGSDALVCGGDCYKQASRNFKRGMSGYKVARLVDLLAQMGEPVTAAQLLARYRDTYGKSAMMGFNNTNAVTQKLMPIVNPETIRVDKTKNPFTFEYLGGTTIGEWLKPSMRAKYESVSFKAESFSSASNWSEYAPTERIIRRLKDSGVWELGDAMDPSAEPWDVIKWWATVKIKDGTLVRATEEELGDLTLINIVLLDGQYEAGYGRVTVSYSDVDNAVWLDSYQEEMEQLRNELTIIFKNNGMFQSGDDLEYGDMGEFYNVHWGDLVSHSCADNAELDSYEDGIIVMECNSCGRTATFREETPYEGPRNAETFGAESDSYEWEWDRTDNAPTELIKKRLKEAGFKLVREVGRYKDMIVEHYEPKLVAKNGNLLDVALSQNEEFDGFSRLTFYDDNDENATGKAPPMDWDILYEKGLLKGEDSVENPQLDYYQVYWCGLYDEWKNGHNCADNAKFDIYEDNFIVMECNSCGKTATFEQKTPYEGPRKRKDAETFEAEYAPSVEGMIDNPAGYYSYWQSFCEYMGVNDAHTAWRMVEKPWKWRPELEKWVNDSEWFSQEAESFEAEEKCPMPDHEGKKCGKGLYSSRLSPRPSIGRTTRGMMICGDCAGLESYAKGLGEWVDKYPNRRHDAETFDAEYELKGTMQSSPASGYNGYMNMMSSARRIVEIGNETGLDQKLGEAYQDESGRWFLPILQSKASKKKKKNLRFQSVTVFVVMILFFLMEL